MKNKLENQVTWEHIINEKMLIDLLHEDDDKLNAAAPTFKAVMHLEIQKKSSKLHRRYKRKKEVILLAGSYIIFLLVLAMIVWSCMARGLSSTLTYFAVPFGVISAVLICCIPLIIKFKANISERGDF